MKYINKINAEDILAEELLPTGAKRVGTGVQSLVDYYTVSSGDGYLSFTDAYLRAFAIRMERALNRIAVSAYNSFPCGWKSFVKTEEVLDYSDRSNRYDRETGLDYGKPSIRGAMIAVPIESIAGGVEASEYLVDIGMTVGESAYRTLTESIYKLICGGPFKNFIYEELSMSNLNTAIDLIRSNDSRIAQFVVLCRAGENVEPLLPVSDNLSVSVECFDTDICSFPWFGSESPWFVFPESSNYPAATVSFVCSELPKIKFVCIERTKGSILYSITHRYGLSLSNPSNIITSVPINTTYNAV